MFTEPTVFILGAGASWHYGYPTGEGLIKDVKKKAQDLADFFNDHFNWQGYFLPEVAPQYIKQIYPAFSFQNAHIAFEHFAKQCNQLVARLNEVNPLVIDYFLEQNEPLQDIGKLMIAWVILECESQHFSKTGNSNRKRMLEESPDINEQRRAKDVDIGKHKDDWYRFLVHELVQDYKKVPDLCANQVTFITFNYDVSLECRLSKSLQHSIIKSGDRDAFLSEDRVLYLYGKVRENAYDTDSYGEFSKFASYSPVEKYQRYMDKAWGAAQLIKTIPEAKKKEKEIIQKARDALKESKNIYILGYGFDDSNSEVLKLREYLINNSNSKRVFFTNFQDSNRINKRASKLFFNEDAVFTRDSVVMRATDYTDERKNNKYEKSTRDVYEALELDFELFS